MDRKESLKILKTAKGQIEAIINMVEDERYCIDISNQFLAAISLLKKANFQILNSHLENCVKDTGFSNDQEEIGTKIKELEKAIEYLSKVI